MYSKEVYKTENRYGYHILQDGNVIISQDYAPDVDGFVEMTEEEANLRADQIIHRLEN